MAVVAQRESDPIVDLSVRPATLPVTSVSLQAL